MNTRSSKLKSIAYFCATTAAALTIFTVAPSAREPAQTVLAAQMEDQCDRLAGSPFDQNRNPAYAPVGLENITGDAATACRIAFENSNNPRFAFQLGRALNGSDNAQEAMTAYETAAKANYAAAKVNLGMLLGRIGDSEAEFKLYKEAAEAGNMLAAYNLGVSYRDGNGTPQDAKLALKWFETAAANGDDTAAFNIGVIYDEGTLVPEDNQMAIAWYDVAAKRGNKDAMINLAIMYETGEGIPANAQAAAELYAQAAAKGDEFGATKLAQLAQAGVLPKAEQEPQVSALPKDFDMLVLSPSDVETPSAFKNI